MKLSYISDDYLFAWNMSCVPNVASVSGLSIRDYPFGVSKVYYPSTCYCNTMLCKYTYNYVTEDI